MAGGALHECASFRVPSMVETPTPLATGRNILEKQSALCAPYCKAKIEPLELLMFHGPRTQSNFRW